MSSLRGRTRDSSWQWMLIGLVLGLGCSGVLCVGTYALNFWTLNIPGVAQNPTIAASPETIIITATPEPVTPTEPVADTETPSQPSATVPGSQSGVPTATPYLVQPTAIGSQPTTSAITIQSTPSGTQIVAPTPLPTIDGATAGTGLPDIGTSTAGGASTTSLSSITTQLIDLPSSPFKMGTTLTETTRALQDCADRDKATNCDPAYVQDSFPEHDVAINAFAIEKYEVTTEQFVAFLNSLGPNSHKSACGGTLCAATTTEKQFSQISFDGVTYKVSNPLFNLRPITYVSWYGADAYCRAISRRLPTEAEWEYAARGPNGNIYPWGNFWDPEGKLALTSRPTQQNGANDVNSYPSGATPTGIFNMSGNVSEWVSDWYDANAYANTPANAIDPKGPASGTAKVTRGGDWSTIPLFARAVHRREVPPESLEPNLGFRCAADTTGLTGSNNNPTSLPSGTNP
ncbi:MAG: SUMF1/EgtB/PvdO family nonheme iron enzyme [Anaerolineae bacterium]|nr:SUMF1/EgtB/PvdO family nonheme iron enzyme [Anaerolineae bacterium]